MGNRLRPYTDRCPKPLVSVGGRPIIDHVIGALEAAGVRHVTVNTHYKAGMLEDHLRGHERPAVSFSREDVLMDTGGGIKKALASMGAGPFYVVSGDSFWAEAPGHKTVLQRLAEFWNPDKMDMALALQPLSRMALTPGLGDYDLSAYGRCVRSHDRTGAYMWTSIRICTPAVFEDTPDAPFSFLSLLDRAEQRGRLYGIVHEGEWYHITTPDDLDRVNAALPGQGNAKPCP